MLKNRNHHRILDELNGCNGNCIVFIGNYLLEIGWVLSGGWDPPNPFWNKAPNTLHKIILQWF